MHVDTAKKIKGLRLILCLFLLVFCAMGAYTQIYCVRSGATGSGSGANWTDAFTALPGTLVRGATYYVADGNYPSYTFDDPVAGTTYITVKKATVSNHGPSTGWNNAYGDGVATFGAEFTIDRGYFVFDGATGGGPDSWESGFGFNITTGNTANIRAFRVADSASVSNVTIRHTEIAGPDTEGVSTGIYSVANGTSDITIEYCWLHGHGEGLIRWHACTDVIVQYCALTTNPIATPAHHGSGATFWGTTDGVTVRWNRFRTLRGTGWLGFYDGNHTDPAVYGNIFFADGYHEGGNGVVYDSGGSKTTINGWVVYNNTFSNIDISLITSWDSLGSGNICRNNLAYDCPYGDSMGTQFDTVDNNTDTDTDPFVDSSNADFHPSGATDAGNTLGSPYNIDMDGETRGADGFLDRGAIEFDETGGQVVAKPKNLRLVDN